MDNVIEPTYHLRSYQVPLSNAILRDGYRKALLVGSRRMGKDFVALHIMLHKAIEKPGLYLYCLPTQNQGRLVIWNGVKNDGSPMLSIIPEEFIARKNNTEMLIELVNGSQIRVMGSDNADRVVGSNPSGIVFSEYGLALHKYPLFEPMLQANDGWVLFISTPRKRNHFYDLYQIAKQHPKEWFVQKLTVEDTKHIPLERIQQSIDSGLMTEQLARQEYYGEFLSATEGAFYEPEIDRMEVEGRLGVVPWESEIDVYTAWDLGMRDDTSIIFFQLFGQEIRIIDCYTNRGKALSHYIKIVKEKPYVYGGHLGPHDLAVRELSTGVSRKETAYRMGIDFTIAPNLPLMDGINAVRAMLSRTWIDQKKCDDLLKALRFYHSEYNEDRKIYSDKPIHDWSSHFADAVRYMAVGYTKLEKGMTPEELARLRNEAAQINAQRRMY